MPFADMRGLVAVPLEQPRDRRQLRIEPIDLSDLGVARAAPGDADEADLGRKKPRQETRARPRTTRRGGVEFDDSQPSPRTPIELRGPYLPVPPLRPVPDSPVAHDQTTATGP